MVSMKGTQGTIQRILLILIICSFFLSSQSAADKNTSEQTSFYVSSSENVQSIIDQAPEHSIIHLLPGTYTEQLTIRKTITLSGFSKDTTKFIVTTEVNKPAITLSAPDIILENLTVINQGPGIYTTGIRTIADHITIKHCSIQKTPVGIALWSSNNTINNCVFTECSDEGIVIISSSYKKADNNIIKQCVFTKNCDGIELQGSCYNIITDCHFEDNTHDGIDAIRSDNNINIISHCTVINNAVHGIYFSSSAYNTITDCIIAENADENILFTPVKGTNIITNVTFELFSTNVQMNQTYKENMPEGLKQKLIDRFIDMFSSIRTIFPF